MKKKKLGIICLAGLLMTAGVTFSACRQSDNSGNSSNSSVEIIDNRTISLNKTELTLTRGERETLTAQLSVGKGDFTWTSSNEAVATVSQSGEVCAVEVGTATITVTYEDVTATCTVTVQLPDYVPVFKNSEQSIPLWVGASYSIDGTVTFGGEEVAANVSYVSQDTSVVTVDENGVVQGVGVGETTVTVTAEYFGLTEQMVVDVTVTEPIIIRANAQTLELDTITDENVGFSKEGALSIEVFNQQEDITNDLTYAWEIVGESIVQFEADGANLAIVATGIGETKVKVGFTFNGQEYENVFNVTVNRAMYEISDMVAEDYSGQIVMALPEGISIAETPETITFGDNEATLVSMSDGNIVLEKGLFDYSKYEVHIEVGDYGYVAKSVTYCTKVLYSEDTANFLTLLSETPNGYFVLSENLDFDGSSLTGFVASFSGTLDGNGYALKNFANALAQDGNDWVGYFIKENTGTIKNLLLQYTMAYANVAQDAFIYKNNGTIENVKMSVSYAFKNDCWNPGSLVGLNYGTVRNVVAVMNKTSDVICAKVGCMIGANYSTGIVEHCYVVNNGLIVSGAEDGIWIENVSGSKANCFAYSTMAELAAVADLSAANGWSNAWKIESGVVLFGEEEIIIDESLHLTAESKNIALYVGEPLEEGQTSVATVSVAANVMGSDVTSETTYSWVAENANVSVAGNGATAEITAVTAGSATVTVTAERNGKTATYTFN
ncbi:MAG: Ig-like domain-containing protein, partial [Clostridia bacterium]|nr:Ig-like domain-containing protein [Clostridia bacterium]